MSDRLHIATRKGLFTFTRAASGQWKVAHTNFLGARCCLVMRDPRDGSVYAALEHGHFGGKLHRSTDDGATFTEIAVPAYPAKPENYKPKHAPVEGNPAPWSLKMIWALTPGGADQPGTIWCGTIPGGLFRSDDHGKTWEINKPLWEHDDRERWFGGGADWPGIHSVCVDPRDSNHVSLAVSCAGCWHTHDGGKSWNLSAKGMRAEFMPPEKAHEEMIQDPHIMVACPSKPDEMWVQHHNGIFRSLDHGLTWTEITDVQPSNFGFAVAVHPTEPDTAWFVPGVKDEARYAPDGKVVVTRTRDGGKSFDQLRNGLPQEHAYDIVFRHSLDIDGSGNRLAFGSTTGNVWLTENQGDSWTTLSTTLPPVYAVRFG
ncbi:MAG: exo-alpha-sialidase [Planctomycetota bacterium]